MSYLAKKKRSFLMRCYLPCQNFVMLGLILSLMLLLAGLGLSIYYDELPVPDRVIQIIEKRLENEGIKLDYEMIGFDFRGNLIVKNARLSFTKEAATALEIESLYLDINYTAIFLRKDPLDLIKLGNASLYSPAVVSLSGTNEKLVTNVSLEIYRQWTKWHLTYFTAKFQTLDISAAGELSALVEELFKPREKKNEAPELYVQYLRLCRLLTDTSTYLQSVTSPEVDLQFSSPDKSEFIVDVQAQTSKFSKEGLPIVDYPRCVARVQVLPEISLLEPLRITAQLIEDKELNLQATDISAAAWINNPVKDFDGLFPVQVQASTGSIIVQDNKIDHFVFDGQILNKDEATGRVISSIYGGAMEVSLQGNWKEKTASGLLKGSLNVEGIIQRPEFDHLWKLRWSKQNKPIYLDLEFNYPGNLKGLSANFRAETRDIEVIKTPFAWARARGTLEGTTVDVTSLEGGGNGNDLNCTFRQDLKEKFYRFTMVGRFRPHDIDVWWRDWWKNTFDYLDIKGDLPWMDLSIRNAFTYKKQLTLFGFAEAENINLKGMHFDQASAKMFIRPNYIDATNLKLVRPEGEATGEFQRHLVLSELKNVIVDIKSNLDLEPSMELFGESGLRIIEPYTWSGNPVISLVGEFNFENGTNWQDLDFTIDTDKPMTLYQFPFDSLQVNGTYDRGNTLLEEVAFDFAGGSGTGEASYLRQDDQAYLLFDFDIKDAELEETLKRIALIKTNENTAPVEEKPTNKKSEPLQGKLSVHASGISPAGAGLDRVMAKGEISVKDGNLAQIPIFGPLSSLIPFTKLHLTDATSFFAWDNGKMTFPNLRMTSSTARLEGLGDYYTNNSELDFQVRVFLLSETDIPLISNIIMPIFDPFSQMAAVNLKGTLKKPEWRFAISPFNWFNQKPGPRETQPSEELLDFEFRK
jgi:hypothetical protein